MARPARPWFRFYTEAFTDEKLLRLAPTQRWLWVAILGAARRSAEPGRLVISTGEPMTASEIARFADVPEDEVWPALEAMRRYGMVAWDDDGLIEVCNWSERQYESDTSAKRTRNYRERHNDEDCDVTTAVTVTSQVTPPETETETDTERGARKRATTPTDAFAVTDKFRTWAEQNAPGIDLDRERSAWIDWARANGKTFKDLDAGFRTWCRRAQEWRGEPVKESGPARAILGRGADAPPTWELDDDGNARLAASG